MKSCCVALPNLEIAKIVVKVLANKGYYCLNKGYYCFNDGYYCLNEADISAIIEKAWEVETPDKFAISFIDTKVTRFGYCNIGWYIENNYKKYSIEEVLNLPELTKPFFIGGYIAAIYEEGDKVEVGCTTVTFKEVEDLYNLIKKERDN